MRLDHSVSAYLPSAIDEDTAGTNEYEGLQYQSVFSHS